MKRAASVPTVHRGADGRRRNPQPRAARSVGAGPTTPPWCGAGCWQCRPGWCAAEGGSICGWPRGCSTSGRSGPRTTTFSTSRPAISVATALGDRPFGLSRFSATSGTLERASTHRKRFAAAQMAACLPLNSARHVDPMLLASARLRRTACSLIQV